MAKLFKETMKPIHIELTSGTRIRLVPTIGNRDNMVLAYSSEDIDIAFHLPAKEGSYYILSNHIQLGRYSQALSHAAYIGAIESYKELSRNAAKLGLIA